MTPRDIIDRLSIKRHGVVLSTPVYLNRAYLPAVRGGTKYLYRRWVISGILIPLEQTTPDHGADYVLLTGGYHVKAA